MAGECAWPLQNSRYKVSATRRTFQCTLLIFLTDTHSEHSNQSWSFTSANSGILGVSK